MRSFVKQKNADEVIQQFFYHTTGAHFHVKTSLEAPVSEQQVRKDAQEGETRTE